MRNALCIECGSFKRSFAEVCAQCRFEPKSPLELAQSRVLASPYSFSIGTEGDVVETGRTQAELAAISQQIKSGTPYAFPPQELAGVLTAYNQAQQVTPRRLLVDGARWLAPPLILAAVLLAFLFFRR